MADQNRIHRRALSLRCLPVTMPAAAAAVLLLALVFALASSVEGTGLDLSSHIYHSQFAVLIPHGKGAADKLAERHGFKNLGQIGDLENYYLFERADQSGRSKRSVKPDSEAAHVLEEDPEVEWFEQQEEKRRIKRDGDIDEQRPLWDSIFNEGAADLSAHHVTKRQQQNSGRFGGGDPMFNSQWHLNHGARGGFDMNVQPAWARGVTGKGVVVTILDDGIQTNHPDLRDNYDPLASTDINDNDHDPMPQDNGDNKHGTRCAGEVAAQAYNGFCGIGIAYNASIGGVRMLDGVVNDAVEARALSLNPNHVDIYSASWGPEDDGKTVDGPGPLAKRAFLNGVVRGRHGKGSIFVWASGNGGRHLDNCNCDGYTNSIFTLSISSATQGGYRPWYLEECSSTLATTYSSGTPGRDGSISTVDQDARLRPDHICTDSHTGTSASAPIAAGMAALALDANPNLTWRDMQYIVVMSSRYDPLREEPGWSTNGVGRKFSHKFGYGLMDADHMVELATKWKSLPQQHICQTVIMVPNARIPDEVGQSATTTTRTDGCQGTLNSVRYLEHVQCKVSLNYYPRGNVMIRLTSPAGTSSVLLFPRPKDSFSNSFEDWPFLSVHFWGENPAGQWKLEVLNMNLQQSSGRPTLPGRGLLRKWQLVFYGTNENPVRIPRNVGGFRTGKQSSQFSRPLPPPSPLRPSVPSFSFPAPSFSFPNFFNAGKRLKRWVFNEKEEEEEVEVVNSDVPRTTLADVYL